MDEQQLKLELEKKDIMIKLLWDFIIDKYSIYNRNQ